jgi:hypothetical protein
MVVQSNVSRIYKKLFRRHKNTLKQYVDFGSKLLPSSGETTRPRTQFTKNII